jgi:hypothetical protein
MIPTRSRDSGDQENFTTQRGSQAEVASQLVTEVDAADHFDWTAEVAL